MRERQRLSPERVRIARERMEILFNLAEKEFKDRPERSRRYVELARKIGMKCNVRLRPEQKSKFCKKCNNLLIPKKSCKVKTSQKKKLIEIECMNCGRVYRRPYTKI